MDRLPLRNYPAAKSALNVVEINHLFARSVLEGQVDGAVYVDSLHDPKVFYVKHPYGMSLLYGNQDALACWEAFWSYLNSYSHHQPKDEWLQAWPEELAIEIDQHPAAKMLEDCAMEHPVEKHTRVNFNFDRTLFPGLASGPIHGSTYIARTGRREYKQLQGTVVANCFWRNCDAFLRDGVGFSLLTEGIVVSTAFSAFIHKPMLELGIETRKDYQGRGYAFATCCHLIEYCLEIDYKPVWSCRLGNTGSVRLAEKLGFKPSMFIPYFRLMGAESRAQQVAGGDAAR